MIVLGVNGSPYGGHDASACIVKDRELCVVAEEERFTRLKHAYDVYPHASIAYCLRFLGISLDQIDHVAYGWDLPELLGERWRRDKDIFIKELFPRDLFAFRLPPKISFIPHHMAHAASTFWCSGFQKSSILIMDGQGERASGVMAYGDRGTGISVIEQFPIESSLGYLYKAAAGLAGLGRENPGKLMGLSAYGRPLHAFSLLRLESHRYTFDGIEGAATFLSERYDEMKEVVDWWIGYFTNHCKIRMASVRREWDLLKNEWLHNVEPDVYSFADFAASVQKLVELVGCHLVNSVISRTQCPYVSLAGGVALNCSMNGKIALMPEVKDLFIFPASHDSGTSVGAALQKSFDLGVPLSTDRLESCYLGPEYDNEAIERILQAYRLRYRRLQDDILRREVANLIARDLIIALFFGRSEYGPRALGHRSIIAAPNSKDLRDKVNRTKGRELWRPLCPSVLENFAAEFFHDASMGSRFMLRSLVVKESKRSLIPGVVHVDGTARAQLVESATPFGRLIEEYYGISGLPLVLNTSFNLSGEPIVGSPVDALRSFFTSSIDALVLGSFLIEKETEQIG